MHEHDVLDVHYLITSTEKLCNYVTLKGSLVPQVMIHLLSQGLQTAGKG